MNKTKYAGVFERTTLDGVKTYYIKYSLKGKQYQEKVGTALEGITAVYASKIRAKRTSVDRLKEDAPILIKQKQITFDEAFNLYFKSIEGKSDAENIKGRYNNHVRNEIGKFRLDDITNEVVDNCKAKWNNKKKASGVLYAAKTVNDWINIIGTVFNFLIEKRDYKLTNPAHAKKIERNKIDNDRERYLELNEIKELWDYLNSRYGKQYKSNVTEDLKVFVALSLSTGARLTSILTISKRDINLNQNTILIKNHKSNRTYYGYINKNYKDIIEERFKSIRQTEFMVGGNTVPRSRASIAKSLQPILNELFNQGISEDDIKRRTVIHTLRHTFASQLAIQSVPIFTIMKLMDHSDINQTIRYSKLAPNSAKDNVWGLEI